MYNHGEIDKKWQDKWLAEGVFKAEDFSEKPKKYLLVEFPFPSGAGLHVGHPRSYVALDVLARKLRMQGNNVLYPMGWDAFGLPTENYAIKTGRPPAEVTAENIATFKAQIQSLGLSFDWSREVNSTDPGYYKWTQWQFLQFFKAGLAYKAKSVINWCPKDKIGLANEEAQGGICERCGGPVEKREKEQWMIGITKYADRLITDLETVNYLPKIQKQQEEWIGKSEGAEIEFSVVQNPQILFASTNGGKAKLFRESFDKINSGIAVVAPSDLGITPIEVEEGSDLMENAEKKARAYFGKTDLPILANDAGVEIEGENLDPAFARRNALVGIDEKTLSPEEIAQRVTEFYSALAKKYGGTARTAIHTAFVLLFPDGRIERVSSTIKGVLVETPEGELDVRMPLNNLFKVDGSDDVVAVDGAKVHAAWTAMNNSIADFCGKKIRVFTTRPDTLFGVTYITLAPEHDFVKEIVSPSQRSEVEKYVATVARKTEIERTDATREKTGVFTGAFAVNPVNAERVPIWISDYVLAGYGTGAVMAVPAHDERDFEFAKKFGLEMRLVVAGDDVVPFTEEGIAVNSEFLNGLTTAEAKQKMISWLEEQKAGARKITYKLRDWVFSRQRYWGEPIPLVHCDHCAAKKQKVLFVHAFGSTGSKDAIMRAQLEALGFEVLMPRMSTVNEPDFEKWMEELAPYFEQLGEDDIVIGHSLGGHAAASALLRANKKIKALLLMAPSLGEFASGYWEVRKQENPTHTAAIDKLSAFIARPVDLQKVSVLADAKEVVWSDDDTRVPEPTHELYPTGWYINRVTGQNHFYGTAGVKIFVEMITKYKNTGWVSLPDSALPLTLPPVEKYEPTDNGESPLASIPEFVNTTCPRCGGAATRETDTMPNWAGSSWYFLRYIDAHNDKEFAAADKLKYWMPVDLYNGGMEHTTLHLLYSRFWNKFMFDLGFVPTVEPYARRVSHGLIMASDGNKMSKSKGNVVNPDEIVREQGADTLRAYELFIGPFAEPAPWSENGVAGVKRFLDRVMRLPEKVAAAESEEVTRGLHKMLARVTEDLDRMSFNTVVAQYMTFVNTVYGAGAITKDSLQIFLRALNVVAPHVSEELWAQLGGPGLVCQQSWPQFTHSLTLDENFELVVQVNGKVRDRIQTPSGLSEDELKKLALASLKVQEWLQGKEPQKIVVIKNKLVSIAI